MPVQNEGGTDEKELVTNEEGGKTLKLTNTKGGNCFLSCKLEATIILTTKIIITTIIVTVIISIAVTVVTK